LCIVSCPQHKSELIFGLQMRDRLEETLLAKLASVRQSTDDNGKIVATTIVHALGVACAELTFPLQPPIVRRIIPSPMSPRPTQYHDWR
jgi:hypothetical protein